MLEMLRDEPLVEIVGMADKNPDAKGMHMASDLGITVFSDIETAIEACKPCVAFNLTGNEMVEDVVGESLGVGGVIGGLEARLIVRMVSQIKETREQLRYEATHDALTGIYNRRHMQTLLGEALSQASRYGHPYSIALLDLDHFKQVNDTYGHPAGDAVLKGVVDTLNICIRDADIIGRWGGEEFLVLLPHTANADAIRAAGQWLERVKRRPVCLPDGQEIPISFSAGIASYNPPADKTPMSERIEVLLHQADQRLYEAKNKGRGRVCGEA
ncbi:MAG: GGDEF domain-containing protein [Zetaproteobacteria bacterium CG06_land_8_20_14_3_00_59_53]|nr:MAG: GGDEF domain-containing protein [Zetaproteobacteria bacterium CG2_30_59_37]PIO89102.1 MAG: GGDEF domain-containing protein [Zetaproteobacteria bacterium CG23_combo_of_CG06-09_8_20_14_all_59_86]PIQ65774.1 MAG: GGDEF domain-containing protein [Zetaproteobacteria bacterium CG11_big_fil_rev_8_21_14_0_20_59_439]PIU70259.1 MAG: GGDEF domain-containing protein [Zetaproteobacteria bacterium CG06_land_8_20_14_3_00_59_53]PIU96594.1 MAG: GGDEF domain-containing protein [Zetaproteobacteria bacteriu